MKSRRANWVPVVTGLIKKGDQVLVGLRPEGTNLSGHWEFPGGKIEINESPESALKRELKEELNIEVDIGKLAFVSTHSYGDTGIILLFFHIPYWKGEPKAEHHSELKWVRFEELRQLNIPEANKKVLDRIIDCLRDD